GAVADDGEGLGGVELLPAGRGGGVDDQVVGGQPQGHAVHKGLDAAPAGREVVRHQQRPAHIMTPFMIRLV
ncbi:hypothetical protein ADL26_05470, partial [Thermoactinomyces vulgaris]